MLVLVYAGCKGHKSCGDGSVAVPSDDPDGGVTCVAAPDDGDGGMNDGSHSDGHLPPPDGHIDGPTALCGDGLCNGEESCSTCPTDCGSCTPFCGDGLCNGSETCSTCSTDCGSCPPDAATPDAPPNCPPPVTYTGTVVATTVGRSNCSTASCSSVASGPDITYRFTATASGSCHASTIGPSTMLDTVVSVRSTPNGTDISCNDDHGMTGMTPSTASYITWTAAAFTDYYVVVDGYNATSGQFQLTITCP